MIPELLKNVRNGPWRVFLKKKSTKVLQESSYDIFGPQSAFSRNYNFGPSSLQDWQEWSPRIFNLKKNDKSSLGNSRVDKIGPLVKFGKMAALALKKFRKLHL